MTARTTVCAALAFSVIPVSGQGYPAKPLRVLVGFSAGSTSDLIARVLATKMTELLGQPVVVDNRPGAGANIAAEIVAKAPPDGYTVLLANAGLASGATAYVKLNFNAVRDFAPVSQVSSTPAVLVVHPSLGPKSVKELIAFIRARPDELNFASTGHGNFDHLGCELFNYMSGLRMMHVAYKGGPQALGDVMAGQVALYLAGLPIAVPLIKAGRLRALGLTDSKRAPLLPEVPTIAEGGVPGYEHVLWNMLAVPVSTPRSVLMRLNQGSLKALRASDVHERYAAMGVEPVSSTPEEAFAYLKSETEKYAKVVKAIGLRIE